MASLPTFFQPNPGMYGPNQSAEAALANTAATNPFAGVYLATQRMHDSAMRDRYESQLGDANHMTALMGAAGMSSDNELGLLKEKNELVKTLIGQGMLPDFAVQLGGLHSNTPGVQAFAGKNDREALKGYSDIEKTLADIYATNVGSGKIISNNPPIAVQSALIGAQAGSQTNQERENVVVPGPNGTAALVNREQTTRPLANDPTALLQRFGYSTPASSNPSASPPTAPAVPDVPAPVGTKVSIESTISSNQAKELQDKGAKLLRTDEGKMVLFANGKYYIVR